MNIILKCEYIRFVYSENKLTKQLYEGIYYLLSFWIHLFISQPYSSIIYHNKLTYFYT